MITPIEIRPGEVLVVHREYTNSLTSFTASSMFEAACELFGRTTMSEMTYANKEGLVRTLRTYVSEVEECERLRSILDERLAELVKQRLQG